MWQIVENTGVISLLQNSLQCGRLPNAYLVSGPEHVGKMTLALNIAQALNCSADVKPCRKCPSCLKIDSGKHADVQIVGLNNSNLKDSKAKEIGIERIRDIQHSASLPPFEGKYKVFIIDGAELLSNEASNCLLKTLEEPVGNVIYLLLTVNEQSILPTVISRCQRLELKPLSCDTIEKNLDNRNIEPFKAKLLSRLSHGCLGWAINATEDETLLEARSEQVKNILEVMQSGLEERFEYSSQLSLQFNQSRKTVFDELKLWLDWWHDLFLAKTANCERITNADYESEINKMAEIFTIQQIRVFINRIQQAITQLQMNASSRLVLDVLMLNIPRRNQ
jgi:DNA polymerase III subunit delta'